jgi:hypothetical protein
MNPDKGRKGKAKMIHIMFLMKQCCSARQGGVGLKIRTNVKAGGRGVNHNQTLVRQASGALATTAVTLFVAASLLGSGSAYGRNRAPKMIFGARVIMINGNSLTPGQLAALDDIERARNLRLPDGAYWYDKESGLAGAWNQPAQLVLVPYMDLGGPMRSNCSGGGTGVFVNGRELHPSELSMLSGVALAPNLRYSLDPRGNLTPEIKEMSRREKFAQRLRTAVILSAQQQAAAQQAQAANSALNKNQNGGRAKYAMDGIHVGPGYYLDRGAGTSATRY